MNDPTRARIRWTEGDLGFATSLRRWLEENTALLHGLVALRKLGAKADDAVDAVLELKDVMRTRLSWELWDALTEGRGEDPDVLLLEALAVELLDLGRRALWGEAVLPEPEVIGGI